MADRFAVILAAGKGTRMKSSRAKVLHEVGGRTMLAWSAALANDLGCRRAIVVVAPDAPEVARAASDLVGANNVVVQSAPLGTANAVEAARSALEGAKGEAVILYADTPLVPKEAVERAFGALSQGAGVCVLGFKGALPNRYGRLELGPDGSLEAIVEANDADADQLANDFCNSGVLTAPTDLMFALLAEVTNDNAKGEYYLTDLVRLARRRGLKAAAARCEERDVLGVNSQAELAAVEAVFQGRRRAALMADGVSLVAPDTVFVSYDTNLAPGVVVEPNVVFGTGVTVAAGALIRAFSHLEGASVAEDAIVGPYARLRPGARLGPGVHIGNFVEVKNVVVGAGAKANHLAYLGDGEIGEGANVGAGTIFCNYDGFFKYRTVVGAGAFIGSNAALVAPLTVGEGAYVGSGSVVTEDVPADALALGRGRQTVKAGWAATFRNDQQRARKEGRKPKGSV